MQTQNSVKEINTMNKVIAFILGTVFGMILLLGAVAGIVYYVGWELTPKQVEDASKGTFDSSFLGDFKELSIAGMVEKIGKLYEEKAGKLLSTEPDEDGHYYTIGEFFADNNMSLDTAFGLTLPQSVKDIPVFEFFAKSIDGETGVDRALKQIKLDTIPDIVSLFAGQNKIVSDAVLIKLSDDSLFDLFDSNVGIIGVLEDITFAELLPDVFPADDDTTTIAKLSATEGTEGEGEGTNQSVDQMRTLMVALGKTRIGAAIHAFTDGGNILLELKQGCPEDCAIDHEHTNDGVFVELGKIEFTALIGNDPTISSILGGKTISDILSDEGNITVDPILNDLYVGSLIGLKQDDNGDWVNEDGSPADAIYASFAELTVKQLMDDKLDALNDITIGELIGYVRNQVDAANYTTDTIIVEGVTYVKQSANDTYAKALLTCGKKAHVCTADCAANCDKAHTHTADCYTWYEAELTCTDQSVDHAHNQDCYGYVWYSKCTEGCTHTSHVTIDGENCVKADALYGAIGSISVGELMDGSTDKLMDTVKTLTLKEFAGDNLDGVMEALSDKTIGELMDGAIDDLYIGQLLQRERKEIADNGYTAVSTLTDVKLNNDSYIRLDGEKWYEATFNCDQTHTHTADCYEFIWYIDNTYATAETGVTAKLANQTVGGLDNLDDLINDLTLVDVMGKGKVPDMLQSIENTKIGNLSAAIDNMYLGEFLKYHRNEITATAAHTAVGALADVKQNNGNYIRLDGEKWYEATFNCDTTHEHTATCYEFVWYTDEVCTNEATGVTAKLANQKVNELNNIDSVIDDLTLAEVMGEDKVPDMLKSIGDTKLSDIDTAINGMRLGEMLGYKRNPVAKGTANALQDDGVWYESEVVCGKEAHVCTTDCAANCDKAHTHTADCYDFVWYVECTAENCTAHNTHTAIDGKNYVKADGMMANLASLKISELKDNDAIQGKIERMKLGDVMTIDNNSSQILQKLKDSTLGSLGDDMNKLTLADVIEIDNKSPYLLRKLQSTKLDELSTQMNDLTIADVVDTTDDNTSPILKELAGQKVNDLDTAINDLYAGTAMGYYRKSVDVSGYTTNLATNVKGDGTNVAKSDDGNKWHEAKLDCTDSTHTTHTADCYAYVWYEDESHTTAVSGVTAAFVNSKIDNMAAATNDLTLTKLGIVDENSSNLLKAVKDTKLDELGTAINDVKMGVMFGYEEVNGEWYVKCDDDCEHGTNEHITLEGKDGNYTEAKGLYKKLSGCTVKDLSDNHTLTDIVKKMTMGDFMDSGMLTIEEENQTKLDLMCGQCTHSVFIDTTIGGITTKKEYKGTLQGYFEYKINHSDCTAKNYFENVIHGECTENGASADCAGVGFWRDMTFEELLTQILKAF